MNISIGQNCLNKNNPLEYIVPPPTRRVGTININSQGHIRIEWEAKLSASFDQKPLILQTVFEHTQLLLLLVRESDTRIETQNLIVPLSPKHYPRSTF